jgi:NAD(P)-dependent dehydrogenase (short-subunit alcohol dehydrogenase family)
MVLGLIRAGARVAIVAKGPSAQLDETLAQAISLGAQSRIVSALGDLRDASNCQRVVAEVVATFGRIDVLVNNAGIPNVGVGLPFWRVPIEEWRRISHTNTDSVFMMTRLVAPLMMKQGFGKIINISTSNRTMVRKNLSPYGPSKAFLEACSRIWAEELSGTGVTLNVLLPGGAVDPAADVTGMATQGKEFLRASVMLPPLLWLASDESNSHSGERFVASLWDENLPLEKRIESARQSSADAPHIM